MPPPPHPLIRSTPHRRATVSGAWPLSSSSQPIAWRPGRTRWAGTWRRPIAWPRRRCGPAPSGSLPEIGRRWSGRAEGPTMAAQASARGMCCGDLAALSSGEWTGVADTAVCTMARVRSLWSWNEDGSPLRILGRHVSYAEAERVVDERPNGSVPLMTYPAQGVPWTLMTTCMGAQEGSHMEGVFG